LKPPAFSDNPKKNGATFSLPPEGIDLEEIEKDLTRQALEFAENNQSAAARLLGLSRAKFRVLLKQLEK
jgi:DNA-binding NtrC family response regulator